MSDGRCCSPQSSHPLLRPARLLQGLDWEGLYPFPTLTLPAVRYSSQNYFLLDMQPDGSIDLLGLPDKNRGGARCSDWWTYRQPGGAQFRGRVEGRDAGAGAAVWVLQKEHAYRP